MSDLLTTDIRNYAGLSADQRRLLYEPIILEEALLQLSSVTKELPDTDVAESWDDLSPDSEDFKVFVNKLAQACNNEQGGSTVTAIVVLQGSDGPEYVLASNQRSAEELDQTAEFLKRLLCVAGQSTEDLAKSMDLKDQILWLISSHNLVRLQAYRACLEEVLDRCLESQARQDGDHQNGKTPNR